MEEKTRIVVNPDSRYPTVVQQSVYKNQGRVDIRKHYVNDAGELAPTKKGVSLSIANGEAGAVRDALNEVLAAIGL